MRSLLLLSALGGCHQSSGAAASGCPANAARSSCTDASSDGSLDGSGSTGDGAGAETGAACVPANPCHTGAMTSAGASSVCVDTDRLLPNGAGCGTDLVCSGGTCVACAQGSACVPSADPCRAGILDCTNGTPTCAEQTGPAADGTTCGPSLVCRGGSCVSCNVGAFCETGNPCTSGAIVCGTGVPVCSAMKHLPDGTSCGTDLVCENQACVPIVRPCTDGGVGCDGSSAG